MVAPKLPMPQEEVVQFEQPNRRKCNSALNQNRRQTVRQLAARCMLGRGMTHRMLKSLNFSKKCAAWVAHDLNQRNRDTRVAICHENLRRFRMDNTLLDRVITGDESWIFAYDPDSKQQAKEWLLPGEDRPTKVRCEAAVTKVMLVIFFDARGVVYREFVPQGQGITAALYRQILTHLREAVRRRHPQLWFGHGGRNLHNNAARRQGTGFVVHHDNAPAHRARLVQNFLNQTHTPTLLHPPTVRT